MLKRRSDYSKIEVMEKTDRLPIINFNEVSKMYPGGIVALKDISFVVDPGEFTFIVGPSGAGKSTVIRLLIKQEHPSEGQIHFEDINVTSIPRKLLSIYRQQLGIVFQDLKLIPSKNVQENIQFALEITNRKKAEIDETTNYLLDIVNLKGRAHLFPEELSGGEKQRVAIARALANDPKLFIADEPTGNLDRENAEEIMNILKAINDWGTTVVVITHDNAIVESMNKRVLRLNQGAIVSDVNGGSSNKTKGDDSKKPSFLKRLTEKPTEKETEKEAEKTFTQEIMEQDRKLAKLLSRDGIDSIEKLLDTTEDTFKKKGYKEKHMEKIEEIVKNYYSNK